MWPPHALPDVEQQRLAGLYKKRGLAALVEEVKSF
jgi:hypothetical protein